MTKIAVYPGTFDPVTNGHIDIIKRASKIFDHLIVAVAKDSSKSPLFDIEERRDMVQNEVFDVDVDCFIEVKKLNGLLVNFAEKNNADVIVRGLRAVSDFEYEFQMYGINSKLKSEIQTIFLPASESNNYIASRLVKEAARLGGDVSNFVSEYVNEKLKKKLKIK
tara:strand:+ start:463 stop:957 length:495 start_codon:yes stop_codon:yes gene_type:complete